ncbi:hypothetical protein UFOVP447_234 [uncultured Caudovirales phage]|uniref:Uncharacterized protein n=1 Tax=uncultured Caudovirales phage TaxID=2100421 RepID=A0A6J5MFD5_9CAUD|nr:hypothetical protein UFOVP447_234 [uncultured Caudovirales phage]
MTEWNIFGLLFIGIIILITVGSSIIERAGNEFRD